MRRLQPLRTYTHRYTSSSARADSAQGEARDQTAQHARSGRTVLQPQPQPTVASDDGARTLRARTHGNKSLPLPPLMDPVAIAAKWKYKQPKRDPDEQDSMTELQRDLHVNFYARALADPVRTCSITKTRLPAHFLLPFTASFASTAPSINSKDSPSANLQLSLVPALAPASEAHNNGSAPKSYALNSRSMVEFLGKKKVWRSMVSPRIQQKHSTPVRSQRKNSSWTWDDEMPDRVLADLRKHAGEAISHGLLKKRIVPLESLAQFSRYPPAAILEIGNPMNALRNPAGTQESTVAIYRIADLLGEEVDSRLLQEGGIGETTSHLAVLRNHRTFKLLFALDKLHVYLRPRE